jgi:hypothetical protein
MLKSEKKKKKKKVKQRLTRIKHTPIFVNNDPVRAPLGFLGNSDGVRNGLDSVSSVGALR